MTKLFTPLLILILVAFCFVPNSFAQKEGLELNKTAVIIPCSPGNPMPAECRGDPSIKVKTTISSKAKNLKYRYSVSGGRIIGDGKQIEWDLLGVQPGTYSIAAIVEGKDRFQRNFSAQITVASCGGCNGHCWCPEFFISKKFGETSNEKVIIFTANLNGGTQTKAKYRWKVSDGKINFTIFTEPFNYNITIFRNVFITIFIFI